MFESLVSRLTSPPVSRRRHTVHATREVCSEPEEEAAPVQRRSRTAKQLLDKRRKARLSCADLTAATNAEPERTSRMDALKAFLPLRQSKSLGRLDGLKETNATSPAHLFASLREHPALTPFVSLRTSALKKALNITCPDQRAYCRSGLASSICFVYFNGFHKRIL
ncbi:unnamed protein product [Leptosia nina]|uniref:Uncharacterized protein n=1 Tax=Leptosia nina TaxID=320188 RepID=A0AAV1K1Y2_9NEOP